MDHQPGRNAGRVDSAPRRAGALLNLVICCDGTNNQFGPENTNVIRLVEALSQDRARQLVFYDPGVGTMPEPQFYTRVGKALSEALQQRSWRRPSR